LKKLKRLLIIIIVTTFLYFYYNEDTTNLLKKLFPDSYSTEVTEVGEDKGSYIIINNNEPDFNDEDKTTDSFEKYSKLDFLGRAGVAYANISVDLMPTTERESIGMIKPTGWHTIKYDIVPGKYLYNRCHLIGYQLTGENKNELNLITCTRQMNTVGMLDWESMVANYIKKTKNNVLYRVTPKYEGNNLLASGVQIEAYSIQDNGKGIKFNIFVKNIQDGIEIDYKTGDSKLKE
jgi:DNA-entry nuclease